MTRPASTAHDAHRAAILHALEAGPLTIEDLALAAGRSRWIVEHTLWLLVGARDVKQIKRLHRTGPTKWRTGYALTRPSPRQRLDQARAMLAQGLTLDDAAWCLELTDAETQALAQEVRP